jgi:hypothetical protein
MFNVGCWMEEGEGGGGGRRPRCLILNVGCWMEDGREAEGWLIARCISVQCISWLRCASACLVAAATYLRLRLRYQLVALATYLRLRLRFAALGSLSARACLTARWFSRSGERSSREGRGGRGEKGRPRIGEDWGRCFCRDVTRRSKGGGLARWEEAAAGGRDV